MKRSYAIHSLTPIVTGDHDRRNKELLATGLLGSLRYQYWLLKAMEEWKKSKQEDRQPDYPPYSADLAPDETIKNKTERLTKALKKVGPVVGLFGGTGWKRMFRLDITNAVHDPEAPQPASARYNKTAPYNWRFELTFRSDRKSAAWDALQINLEKEIRQLMSFVHHYGWLGAAPQNGFGWVEVKKQDGSEPACCCDLEPDNPVFAAKDVIFTEDQFQGLKRQLRRFYLAKESEASGWKKERYAGSLCYIDNFGSPPIGYEIRRWLYDNNGGNASPVSYFGRGGRDDGYAGYVHVSHPISKENLWRLQLRFTARSDKKNNRIVPTPLEKLPQEALREYQNILLDQGEGI